MAANGAVLAFFRKLYYTFTKNWFYIVLAFLTPMLLYYVSQGTEIIAILFDGGNFWNIFLILFSFQLLFYAIWVIPPYSLSITRRLANRFNAGDPFPQEGIYALFSALAKSYNYEVDGKRVYPVRHFAGLPLLIFTVMLMEEYLKTDWGFWGIVIVLISGLYISIWTNNLLGKVIQLILRNKPVEHYGYIIHFVLFGCISFCWMYHFYWIAFILILIYYLFNHAFYAYIETHSNTQIIKENYKANKIKYLLFALSLISLLAFFSWLTIVDKIHWYSSVIIMNVSFTVFIGFIDLFIKTPNDAFKILLTDPAVRTNVLDVNKLELETRVVSKFSSAYEFFQALKFVAIFGLSFYVFFDAFNKHRVRVIEVDKGNYFNPKDRLRLKDYFEKWRHGIDSTKPICLVAGQGGGSRAGSWMVLNLDTLAKKETSFVQNLFAISTVSGSSSGAQMMLNKWSLEQENIKMDTTITSLEMANRIYTYNYLTAATWGMLWSDALRNLTVGKNRPARDRNYYRQLDEGNAFGLCYQDTEREKVKQFFQQDLMGHWYGASNSKRLPLLFLNTATTQAGKRAISAPVIISDSIFGTAIDLYPKVKDQQLGGNNLYNFPLVTAVNLSQSFPFVCAYNYIEHVGNMIDGGLYENSGANTLLEIYSFLIKEFPQYQYRILLIQNSDNDDTNTKSNSSVLLNTLKSAASTPFSGHSHYWEQKLILSKRNTDLLEKIYPVDSTAKWTEVPLGILLSKKSVGRLWECVGRRD